MDPPILNSCPIDQLRVVEHAPAVDWIWEGYLARGNITLLTGPWKTGKTTLVAGLFGGLTRRQFLDQPCVAAKTVVISEESRELWAGRAQAIPAGPNTQLVSRPFMGRPTPGQWSELILAAMARRAAGELDLLVVDPLAGFLPGNCESDPGTIDDLVAPLRRLAESGVAVLILHHPRAKRERVLTARGGAALIEPMDIVLEMTRTGSSAAETCKRRLTGRSRFPQTPPQRIYEWTPGTGEFRVVPEVLTTRFLENWEVVRATLAGRLKPASHRELLADWPDDRAAPSPAQLYEWLARAARERLVLRIGAGTKADPYRFELPDIPDQDCGDGT